MGDSTPIKVKYKISEPLLLNKIVFCKKFQLLVKPLYLEFKTVFY